MYGIGDYYEIKSLKTLAAERFASVAKRGWAAEGFIDVVKAVNDRTSQNDRALRNVLRDYALEHNVEIAKNTDLMTDLAELPYLQDFATDMFRQLVRLQVADKETHEQQLDLKDRETADKDQRITNLEGERDNIQLRANRSVEAAGERSIHVENVMTNLVAGLGGLPKTYRNGHCDQQFSGLDFERKGHSLYPGEGDWVVRCARCRCRLVS